MKQANTKQAKRLGVDIPADLKTEVAIKARRLGLTMTDVIERLLRLWLAGKIELLPPIK